MRLTGIICPTKSRCSAKLIAGFRQYTVGKLYNIQYIPQTITTYVTSTTIWEQLEIAAQYQHYWADNSVSVTVTFKPEEAEQIKDTLEMYETRLKAVSFLRYKETGYEQAPYEPITKEHYEKLAKDITPVQRFNDEEGGSGTKFCDGESCLIIEKEVVNV